jgi:hypothetical protein
LKLTAIKSAGNGQSYAKCGPRMQQRPSGKILG